MEPPRYPRQPANAGEQVGDDACSDDDDVACDAFLANGDNVTRVLVLFIWRTSARWLGRWPFGQATTGWGRLVGTTSAGA